MPSATLTMLIYSWKYESYYGMFRARAPGMIFRLIWCAEIELLIYLNLFIYNNYLRSRSWNNGSIMPSATNINIAVFCVTWRDRFPLKAYAIVYVRSTPDYGLSWTICSKIKSVQRALMNLDNPDELVYDSLISFFLEKRHLIGLITSDYNRNFSEFTWE